MESFSINWSKCLIRNMSVLVNATALTSIFISAHTAISHIQSVNIISKLVNDQNSVLSVKLKESNVVGLCLYMQN